MKKLLHIYAFGSVCRGEIAKGSDVDLLAITSGGANDLTRAMFSIYAHSKILLIWKEGNPFAWHLHLESKLIHSSDGIDFIARLGPPAAYTKSHEDCQRFLAIYLQAMDSLYKDQTSVIFDLSTIFLCLRNFSTCYFLGQNLPNFSRGSALALMAHAPPIDMQTYQLLERARLLCTRGHGEALSKSEIAHAIDALPNLEKWMSRLIEGENL